MNDKKILIPLAIVGLFLLANKSNAASQAARARSVGGYGGFGVGAAQPIKSSTLSNSYYGRAGSTPDIWTQLGQTLGSFAKNSGISDSVTTWAGGVSSTSPIAAANYADSLFAGATGGNGYVATWDTLGAGTIAESAGVGVDATATALTAAGDPALDAGFLESLGLGGVGDALAGADLIDLGAFL